MGLNIGRIHVISHECFLPPPYLPPESMVGDVNLFFNDIDDRYSAEVEIMVAGWCLEKTSCQ